LAAIIHNIANDSPVPLELRYVHFKDSTLSPYLLSHLNVIVSKIPNHLLAIFWIIDLKRSAAL